MANRRILLVEGKDDEHVLKHICGNRGIPHLDEVKPLGSVTNLLETIPVQIRASNEEGDVVGVVIDADTSLDTRWESIRDRLIQAGYHNVPVQPAPDGTIVEPPDGTLLPRVGVWIMPDIRNRREIPSVLGSPTERTAQPSYDLCRFDCESSVQPM